MFLLGICQNLSMWTEVFMQLYWMVGSPTVMYRPVSKKNIYNNTVLTNPGRHIIAPRLLVVITLTLCRASWFLPGVVPSGDPPTTVKLWRRNWWVTYPTPKMFVSTERVQLAMSCCAKGIPGCITKISSVSENQIWIFCCTDYLKISSIVEENVYPSDFLVVP